MRCLCGTSSAVLAFFLLFAPTFSNMANAAAGGARAFSRVELILPEDWDGDEQSGFISDNRDEYCLTVTRKKEDGKSHEAQVSVYILPNVTGQDSEAAAKKLAEAQANSTAPVKEGKFYVFNGEPRANIVRGPAKTLVRAMPEKMLIIIAQDPDLAEAQAIIDSLRGITPDAKALLER